MSDKTPAAQEFKLTIDQDPASSRLSVEDLSAQGPPQELAAGVKVPVFLAIDYAPDSHAELAVRLAEAREPFDVEATRDGNVLEVETSLSDQHFDTRDDTRYVVHVTNRSRYYVADDVHVSVELSEPARAACELPDGNLTLNVLPRRQHVACIEPGKSADLVFVAVSRGAPPGLYPIDITLKYRLLYWDGREAHATSRHALPVRSSDVCFDPPEHSPALRMPRQPSPPRKSAMSDSTAYFPPPRQRTHHRVLHPIHLHVPLEGGGHLDIYYRLTKHNHPNPDHAPCSYGINPDTKSVESYFSTQDTAALEIKLHNDSQHDLKHVRLSDIRIVAVGDHPEGHGHGPGPGPGHGPPKLPDGNLLFEVVPNEAYFGRISSDEKEVKYLSLITRGVAPGRYAVRMNVRYDIEQCKVPVDLWLEVNPD